MRGQKWKLFKRYLRGLISRKMVNKNRCTNQIDDIGIRTTDGGSSGLSNSTTDVLVFFTVSLNQ